MTVRQYVQNNFTEIEQNIFEYMFNSFPETVLVQKTELAPEGEESEDILALIATLAKVIGSSKELILNLKTGHSLNEILQKIEEDYLADSNKKLLLPFASDLKYKRLPDDIETNDLLDRLVEEKYFLQDNYQLYKNRGTLTAITQLVKKWAAYLEEENLTYTLYELKDEVNIVLEGLEEFADFAGGSYVFNFEDETVETTFLRKDIIIFDMLMSIKPVGTNYNILLKYFAYNIVNQLIDRVIRENSVFSPSIRLSNTDVQSTNPQVTNLNVDENDNQFTATIFNPSRVSALNAHVADWNSSTIIQNGFFEDIEEKWLELNYAVEPRRDNVNKRNYIYATTEEMIDRLEFVAPASGTKAIVTGYKWVSTTENDYNVANRKVSFTRTAESISFVRPSVFDVQNEIVPRYDLFAESGRVVVKFTKTFNFLLTATRYFKLTQVIEGGYNGGVNTVDENRYGYFEFFKTDNFSFSTRVIPPGDSRTVSITSTDPSYDYLSSYLGVYFTRPTDTKVKSGTTIIPFAALQGGTDKFAAPISVTATPSVSVTEGQHFTLSNIEVSATASASTEVDSFKLQARSNGISLVNVQIEGETFALNSSFYQDVADALSSKSSLLEAPAEIVISGTTYVFAQWYDVTNDVEISTNETATFTWDANTQIEARYVGGLV